MEELAFLLSSTDLYLTPYRSREQIVSGALTFAVVAGCPVVSTPYFYAEDLLASGAGVLVPFDDPAGFAKGVLQLLDNPAGARGRRRRGQTGRRGAGLARRRRADLSTSCAEAVELGAVERGWPSAACGILAVDPLRTTC